MVKRFPGYIPLQYTSEDPLSRSTSRFPEFETNETTDSRRSSNEACLPLSSFTAEFDHWSTIREEDDDSSHHGSEPTPTETSAPQESEPETASSTTDVSYPDVLGDYSQEQSDRQSTDSRLDQPSEETEQINYGDHAHGRHGSERCNCEGCEYANEVTRRHDRQEQRDKESRSYTTVGCSVALAVLGVICYINSGADVDEVVKMLWGFRGDCVQRGVGRRHGPGCLGPPSEAPAAIPVPALRTVRPVRLHDGLLSGDADQHVIASSSSLKQQLANAPQAPAAASPTTSEMPVVATPTATLPEVTIHGPHGMGKGRGATHLRCLLMRKPTQMLWSVVTDSIKV